MTNDISPAPDAPPDDRRLAGTIIGAGDRDGFSSVTIRLHTRDVRRAARRLYRQVELVLPPHEDGLVFVARRDADRLLAALDPSAGEPRAALGRALELGREILGDPAEGGAES
jgi:hypothetical protein